MGNQEVVDQPTASIRNNPIWMYVTIGLVAVVVLAFVATRLPIGLPTAGKQYRSDLDGFSLRYPAGWEMLGREGLAKFKGVFVFAAEHEKPKAVFGVRIQPITSKTVKLDEVATALDKAMPKNFADFNKLSQDRTTLNGKPALKYEYTFTAQDKSKVHEQLVILAARRRVFHLAAWAPARDFDKLDADFDRMIGSFTAD